MAAAAGAAGAAATTGGAGAAGCGPAAAAGNASRNSSAAISPNPRNPTFFIHSSSYIPPRLWAGACGRLRTSQESISDKVQPSVESWITPLIPQRDQEITWAG